MLLETISSFAALPSLSETTSTSKLTSSIEPGRSRSVIGGFSTIPGGLFKSGSFKDDLSFLRLTGL